MFSELTPDEAGRLDGALFGSLTELSASQPDHGDEMWDETADIIGDLRSQQPYMPPDTADFRLPRR